MKRTFTVNKIAGIISIVACMIAAIGVSSSAYGETNYRIPLRIIPYLDLSSVYDSNFFRSTDDEESDIFINALAGLELSYTGVQFDALATVFGSARRHADFDDADFETYGQSIRLRYGTRDTVKIEANQSFRRVTEEDTMSSEIAIGAVSPDSALDTATSAERDILQAGLRAGFDITDKTQLDLSYRYDFVDYTFRGLDKITTQTAGIEGALRITDKSSGIILTRYGLQDSDGLDDSADFIHAQAGVRTESTDKLHLRATAGYQKYNRPGDLDSEDTFVFDARASLLVTDKLSLHAGGRNGTQLSSTMRGNSAEYIILFMGGQMQPTESIRLSANLAYREDDYIDPVFIDDGNAVDRTDKGTSINLRLDYLAPSEYVTLYTQLTFDSIESPLGDYDRTQLSAGIRLQY